VKTLIYFCRLLPESRARVLKAFLFSDSPYFATAVDDGDIYELAKSDEKWWQDKKTLATKEYWNWL